MNDSTLWILTLTALSVGCIHTLMGPDHYLPFIAMSKARGWNLRKTMSLTLACGLGHVFSSIFLGLIGVGLGIALGKLEAFEAARGNLAAQAMMIFGFSYCIWGIWRAIKHKPHTHIHQHNGSEEHTHEHVHTHEHSHVHTSKEKPITPWVLFIIFVLGPCEPLIPMMMVPAARASLFGMLLVAAAFCASTLITMMGVVFISAWGIRFVKLRKLERYAHALAGGTLLASGAAIQLLGL